MPRSKSFIPLFKQLEVKNKNWGMFPKTILPRGECLRSLTPFYSVMLFSLLSSLFTAVLPKRYIRNYHMELIIIISSKKSTSSQAIALPCGQEIQVPQPVAFASPKVNAHSCTSS